ncbi:hypothetical protein [Ursidibacter arcticus]|nr:hypothetical protein [Ursidibacter arcticus]
MSQLQRAEFFYQFWFSCFCRTGLPCAFKQMMRYFDRMAELKGV